MANARLTATSFVALCKSEQVKIPPNTAAHQAFLKSACHTDPSALRAASAWKERSASLCWAHHSLALNDDPSQWETTLNPALQSHHGRLGAGQPRRGRLSGARTVQLGRRTTRTRSPSSFMARSSSPSPGASTTELDRQTCTPPTIHGPPLAPRTTSRITALGRPTCTSLGYTVSTTGATHHATHHCIDCRRPAPTTLLPGSRSTRPPPPAPPPPPRLPRHRAPPDGPSSPGPRNDRPGPYPRHRALAALPPSRFQPPARALAAERSHCLDASSHHLATGHLRFPGPPPAGATRHLPHHGSGPSDIHASTTHALALSASLPGPHH